MNESWFCASKLRGKWLNHVNFDGFKMIKKRQKMFLSYVAGHRRVKVNPCGHVVNARVIFLGGRWFV